MIAYRKVPPTVMVFYFGGRFWRGKDVSHLPPDAPTKASNIEFSIDAHGEDFGELLPLRRLFLPSQPTVRLSVNGETIYDGPARVTKHAGRRYPHVEHYAVEPVEDTL